MSLQTVQCPDTKQTFKKVKNKTNKTKEEKNPTTLLPHVMDSKPWPTCQFKSMKKSHRESWKIFFPLISQNQGPQCLLEILHDCMFSSCVHHQQTKLPGPCISPGLRGEGTSPRPQVGHHPLTIILPLCFLQDIQSDQHTEQATCSECKQKTSLLPRNKNRASCFIPKPCFKEIQS